MILRGMSSDFASDLACALCMGFNSFWVKRSENDILGLAAAVILAKKTAASKEKREALRFIASPLSSGTAWGGFFITKIRCLAEELKWKNRNQK
jgi:hypothetical protein